MVEPTLNQKTTRCFPADRLALIMRKLEHQHDVPRQSSPSQATRQRMQGGEDSSECCLCYVQELRIAACRAVASSAAVSRVRGKVTSVDDEWVAAARQHVGEAESSPGTSAYTS
jgi:hypothetical protein